MRLLCLALASTLVPGVPAIQARAQPTQSGIDMSQASTNPPPLIGEPPGPSHTGVLADTSLTPHDGDMEITIPGTVIEGKDIHGWVRIHASDVTIRKSIIRGRCASGYSPLIRVYSGTNTVVEDTELIPECPSVLIDGIWTGKGGFVGRRLDIQGTVDGVKAGTGARIEDSHIHDLIKYSSDPAQGGGPSHNDGIQILEGHNIAIVNNTMALPSNLNAAIQITQDFGSVDNVRIEKNYMDGGGCTLNISHKGGSDLYHVHVHDNRFGRNSRLDCPIIVSSETHLTHSGNIYADNGEPVAVKRSVVEGAR